jgi:DNA-binding NarL/FixJ family response regulator
MSKHESDNGRHKVLVVDDHPIVRQGLTQLIGQENDLYVIGGAEDAPAALDAIEKLQPDIALVDISLRETNGIELIKDIKIRHPRLPVLVLSMHQETFYAERVLRAGARGYVTKEEATERVVQAIRQVLSGQVYLSDRMASKMLSKLVEGRPGTDGMSIERLSDRELEVFEFIGHGLTTRQISQRLNRSIKTVESHRANIKRKLKLQNATELLQYAVQWVQSEKGR